MIENILTIILVLMIGAGIGVGLLIAIFYMNCEKD